MQTLVVNNQKGGVGKTVLACHIAWFLAEQPGSRVAFFDFDTQGNASKVLSNAHKGGKAGALFYANDDISLPAEDRPGITLFEADHGLVKVHDAEVANAPARFAKLAGHFDYVVIDTPPSWGHRNLVALYLADHLISPVDLEMFALDGLTQLRANIRDINTKRSRPLNFLGLLASRYLSTSPAQRDTLKMMVTQAASVMFPGVVTQRQGYSQAMMAQEPVWALKTAAQQAAGKEIRPILERLKARIDGTAQEAAA